MALDMTVAGPAAPLSGEDATNDRRRTGERTLLQRAAPVASLVCWFYLSILACLVVWVLVVRLLVGWTPMVVTSGSMQPSINPGDIVLSGAPTGDGEGLEEGTVITFTDPVRPGGTLTHRIERVNADGTYETTGDAHPSADSYEVDPTDVQGVGRLIIPAVGLPKVWLERGDLALMALWTVGTGLALWAVLRRTRRPGEAVT